MHSAIYRLGSSPKLAALSFVTHPRLIASVKEWNALGILSLMMEENSVTHAFALVFLSILATQRGRL